MATAVFSALMFSLLAVTGQAATVRLPMPDAYERLILLGRVTNPHPQCPAFLCHGAAAQRKHCAGAC